MNSTPIPATLTEAAPELARRFATILASLAALVARAYLRHPTRVTIIFALCNYLGRTTRRFTRLAANLAAGRRPRPSRPRPPGAADRPRAPTIKFPTNRGWMLDELRHEAALHRLWIEKLLADPATVELLAAIPSAGRLFRPICHMLGLPPVARPARPQPARAQPARPQPARQPPKPSPEPARPALASPTRPGTDLSNPAHPLPLLDPPCPRLVGRWPWKRPPTTIPT